MRHISALFRSSSRKFSSQSRRARFERLEDRQLMAFNAFHLADQVLIGDQIATADVEPGSIAVTQGLSLSSRPGALATIYLDFNGHVQDEFDGFENIDTPAFNRDRTPGFFSPAEQQQIRFIWSLVAEDFAPFNINVTTVDPDPNNLDPNGNYLRVVISGGNDFTGEGASGFAFVNSFSNDSLDNVAYVFNVGSIPFMADTVSQEAGHAFGLEHQSRFADGELVEEYHTGDLSLGPIMGDPRFAERANWWYSTNKNGDIQDDMTILASSKNGFGYRPDDNAGGFSSAAPLIITNAGLRGYGVIQQTSDVDTFKFVTGGGNVSIRVEVPKAIPEPGAAAMNIGNLDPAVRLFNANGVLIAEDTDPSLQAGLTKSLPAGTYYVEVASFGNYGDVGQYAVSVVETVGPRIVSSQYVSLSSTLAGISVTFNEPINPLTFTIADVSTSGGMFGGTVMSIGPATNGSKTFLITVTKSTVSAWLNVNIGPNITDFFGNRMDQNQNGVNGESIDYLGLSFLGGSGVILDPGSTTPTKTKTSRLLAARAVDAVFLSY